jgi:predicted transcriptional regulator
MPRKTGATLQESRETIRRRYTRGNKVVKALRSEASLGEIEGAIAKETACLLHAAGFSHSYIADSLGLTKGVVNGWFKNDPSMGKRVGEIADEILEGSVKLLRSYTLEAIEMLMEIARTTYDDEIARKCLNDILDRAGVSKVNKSESAAVVNTKTEVDITDKTGLADALKDAPPEVQLAMAEKMDEMLAMAAEHTSKDVTHG